MSSSTSGRNKILLAESLVPRTVSCRAALISTSPPQSRSTARLLNRSPGAKACVPEPSGFALWKRRYSHAR